MISRPAQLVAFAVLLGGTFWMMTLLGQHGRPLVLVGGHGIGKLELARSEATAKTIVDSWSGSLHDVALADIRLDYAFIALYSTTLAIAGFFGAHFLWGGLARLGPRVAYGMWLAGLCDILENLGMTAELGGRYAIAPLVCSVSAIKWVLVIGGLAYGVVTLAAMAVRWRMLISWARGDG